jgi:hypothetical protein
LVVAANASLVPARRVDLNSIATAGALGGLALLWLLPFLWTIHWHPMASLHSELVAACCLAFGALSCGLLRRADARIHSPLPAVLLGLVAVVLLQLEFGRLAYAQLAVRFVLFVSAMLTAYVFGRQIVALGRTREALNVLSAACLAGALYSVLVQWLQLFDLEILPFWLAGVFKSELVQDRPFGNVGQANHQATYLALAGISAIYLGRITRRSWLAPASLLPLATGIALTGSRMGAAFLAVLMLAQFAPTALRPDQSRSRWLTCVAVVAGYLGGLVAVHLVLGAITTLARPTALRYELWWQAWQISLQHPWLGIGAGQFGGGQYWVARPGLYTVPANNAHNLILDLAAELGWPAATAAGAVGLYWGIKDLRRRLASPEQALAWGMVLMIGIHSMLEFPLWHLFFAIPASLLFALGEPERMGGATIDVRRILAAVGAATVAVALMFNAGYEDIARAAAPQYLEYLHLRQRTPLDALPILEVADAKLFKPEVERLLLDLKHVPGEDTPGAPLERSARLLHILPEPAIMAQHIINLARAGRVDEAIVHAGRLRIYAGAGYPTMRDFILDQTRDLGPETAPLRHALREKVPSQQEPAGR